MDFLGLSNLTILAKARDIIRERYGVEIDFSSLPLDDQRTFQLLASGETRDIFQFESKGMRRYLQELRPSKFADISAMVALYRPGPMEQIDTFIKAKQGVAPVHYPHPALEKILEETYGVIVYQEQVMFIARILAGYSMGQADIFRKAMGKKIAEVMKQQEQTFVEGAVQNGIDATLAHQIFALIEPFAGYAFNKGHSVSYALVAYRGAYLKANYPIEYLTAFLNTYSDNTDKVALAWDECRKTGIRILPPDVNRSESGFTIEDTDSGLAIRFGLASVKNVGYGPVEAVVAARESSAFASIEDFCRRVGARALNKKALESLVRVGAFDCLGSRSGLLASLDRVVAFAQAEQRSRDAGQTSMFDAMSDAVPVLDGIVNGNVPEAQARQKVAWERELSGIYFSPHPTETMSAELEGIVTGPCAAVPYEGTEREVVLAGLVASVRQSFTREGKTFVVAELEDTSGTIEVTVWPRVHEGTKGLWTEGALIIVKGQLRTRDGQTQLTCQSAQRYQPSDRPTGRRAAPRNLTLELNETADSEADVAKLSQVIALLRQCPGDDSVSLVINGVDGSRKEFDVPGLSVSFSPDLAKRLDATMAGGSYRIA
jgi:DNA polymerase-3 subunit alpha